ncbi:alpha/beta fold hydrolase [Candidatus Latescibacterota bacterium]
MILIFQDGNIIADTPEIKNEAVILIHGFGRTGRDMKKLETFLRESGYHTECPTLPTTLLTVKECTAIFEHDFPAIAEKYDTLHFVGHSMGGLIIRQFLSENSVPKLGRCVLIATPNQGTAIAGFAAKYFNFSLKIFKSIEDFQPGGMIFPSPAHFPEPEIGVIAGTGTTYMFLGKFLDGADDGLVPVDAVSFPGMKDFVVTPYGHNEIHKTEEVAVLVRTFLQNGTFDADNR